MNRALSVVMQQHNKIINGSLEGEKVKKLFEGKEAA